jgi:hypothetical protein
VFKMSILVDLVLMVKMCNHQVLARSMHARFSLLGGNHTSILHAWCAG